MARAFLKSLSSLILGLAAAALALELLLRFLPVYRGNIGAEPDPAWPAHHLIPGSSYTFSAGWDFEDVRHGRVNNLGYGAPFDFEPGTAGIFVVGDSFIESQMNDYAETLQGRLPALLSTPQPVLGFGTSGAMLPHDLGVARLIGGDFRPTWAVVLITRSNFVGGYEPKPGYYRWDPGSAAGISLVAERSHGPLAGWLRDLRLVAYARGNLRADFSTLFSSKSRAAVRDECRPAALGEVDRRLLDRFVQELPAAFHLPPARVILLFDADRAAIYSGDASASRCPSRDALANRYLAARARDSGVEVIELEHAFREDYARRGLPFDYSPVDLHWNAVGHEVAAREVARYINSHAGG